MARMTTSRYLYYLLAIVLAVTVLMIVITGIQEVSERTREVGILIAMGTGYSYIVGLYMVKMLILALPASVGGFLLGSKLAVVLTAPFLVVQTTPVSIIWSHLPHIMALTCLVALGAEIVPMIKLLRLDPNVILMEGMKNMLEVSNLSKTYVRSGTSIQALRDMSFSADKGELVVVQGPSGSGKSTLLLMLGGMLSPTEGSVLVEGRNIYALSRARRNRYRKFTVGFMFQRFFLMPYLTVYDNILMPLALRSESAGADERIIALSKRLRIDDRLQHLPFELSVGEQQRAAMARALAADPEMILADEPTGNLDADNGKIIATCLEEESRQGRLVILVTHDVSLMDIASKTIVLESRKRKT